MVAELQRLQTFLRTKKMDGWTNQGTNGDISIVPLFSFRKGGGQLCCLTDNLIIDFMSPFLKQKFLWAQIKSKINKKRSLPTALQATWKWESCCPYNFSLPGVVQPIKLIKPGSFANRHQHSLFFWLMAAPANHILCTINGTYDAFHYNDVIMSAMASQITSLWIVYLTIYSGIGQRK